MSNLAAELDKVLSDEPRICKLPHAECMNCGDDLRLFKGRWFHVGMAGGKYYRGSDFGECKHPQPKRCKKCGGRIDYKTQTTEYYDEPLCLKCIEAYDGNGSGKVGLLPKNLKKQLDAGTHHHLMYGAMCSVVITKNGLWFVDIC